MINNVTLESSQKFEFSMYMQEICMKCCSSYPPLVMCRKYDKMPCLGKQNMDSIFGPVGKCKIPNVIIHSCYSTEHMKYTSCNILSLII